MRVLITRPRENASEFAEALVASGAEPIFFPTIQIAPVKDPAPLDHALQRLARFEWLVFTSANAVEAACERLAILGVTPPSGMRIAAVGPKTVACLKAYGLAPHFVPEEFIAEAILPGLGDLRGKHVLLPLADIAHDTLPKAIEAVGGTAHVVTAYHTLPDEPNALGLAALHAGVDVITFTSGSTARNFAALVEHAGLDPFHLPGNPLIVCIGPKTAAAAREIGFQVDLVADEYTVDGLVRVLGRQVNR